MSLGEQIRTHAVPAGSVSLWWLGQASFIFKSPQGLVAAIDPYLTNSCKEPAAQAGFDGDRRFPPPLGPEDLKVDLIALTHSHQDHCDPETIARYRAAGGLGPYLAPGQTMEKLLAIGVPREEIRLTWPNKRTRFGDVEMMATFAIPPAGDDLTHIGYLAFIDSGPMLYFTGDTDYHDVLAYVGGYHPDVMVTVINGVFRNLSPQQAALLTQQVNPRVVIPCHYDLFPDNSLDPRLFRSCLHAAGLSDRYVRLEHGEPFTFTK